MPVLTIRPITVKKALLLNFLLHRRLPKLQGGMFAVRLQRDKDIVGVGIVGRPTARQLDNGDRLQVLRCSIIPGIPNGCSMVYGSCSRIARDAGASDLFTYIHEDESGHSLKASGWIFDEEFISEGGEWNRPSRSRKKTIESGQKLRYWAPWSEIAKEILALKASI